VGRACGTCETGEVHTGFWWRDLRERDHLKDLGVDGWIRRIISKWIFKKWDMDWIDLVQDRWRADVNEVMNLRVP
jgi:hypothetical protein